MKFKPGVSEQGLRKEIRGKLDVIDHIHKKLAGGQEAVCTSARDGKHRVKRSAHYRGDAVDVRIWYVPSMLAFADEIQDALGKHFVVFPEYYERDIQDGEDVPFPAQSQQVSSWEDNDGVLWNKWKIPSHVHVHWAPVYEAEDEYPG